SLVVPALAAVVSTMPARRTALTTEQVGETLLVLFVLVEDIAKVTAHDLERRHLRIALGRCDAVEDGEIALAYRLVLRLFRQLPVDEGARSLDVLRGFQDRDRLGDRGHAFTRKYEVDRRALPLRIERHVLDDDTISLLAARDRLDHGAIAF